MEIKVHSPDTTIFRAERLKFLRLYMGFTLEDLAKITGLSKQILSKYETGKTRPLQITRMGLCNCFNVPADFFSASRVKVIFNGNKITIQK